MTQKNTKNRETKYYFYNNRKSKTPHTHTERERETENNKIKQNRKDTVRRVRGKRIHTLFCFMRKRSEKEFYQ